MEELYPRNDQILEWMKSLPEYPAYKLEDIVLHPDDYKQSRDYSKQYNKKKNPSLPSCIIDDWLYLGSHSHCKSIQVIKQLGITHILNCSDIIPPYFLFDNEINVKYAKISIGDWYNTDIFDYFAGASFIHQCNPLNNDNNKPKIQY